MSETPLKETALIDEFKRIAGAPSNLLVGIGDDTAVVKNPNAPLLFAADMLLDGVHFQLNDANAHLVGRKALAVNLSDIAAMGGSPIAVTVSLAVPDSMSPARVTAVIEGLNKLAASYNVAIAGGDTNIWPHPFAIDVTVIGIPHKKGPVLRSGARPGDRIFVTGPLGGSIHGKHLSFEPRLREAQFLLDHYDIHAMMDLSDGLAKDLRHLLKASACGAKIAREHVPCSRLPDATPCSIEQALCDGEDFELCFTVDEQTAGKMLEDKNYPGKLYDIGVITAEQIFCYDDGTKITLSGYEHGMRAKGNV